MGQRHRGRSMALLMIALLAAMPLAGCLGSAQATAMEQQPDASDLAEAWDEGAQLVRIMGFEGQGWQMAAGMQEAMAAHGDHWSRASQDDNLGDGKTEVWAYRFVSPAQPDQAYTVVLDRDGQVLHEGEEPRQTEDRVLDAWELDSDEAAEIARDENEALQQGTQASTYGIGLLLTQDEDHGGPVWMVAGGGWDGQRGGGGMVLIDAVTGQVLASHGGQSPAMNHGR